MSLNDQMDIDAASIFTVEEFGELVTYKPEGGAPVNIIAIIDRRTNSKLPETTQNLAAELYVCIRNHSITGRTSINEKRDKINLGERWGGAAKDHVVTQVISGDAGVWMLKVR